jgi:acyl-CoA thioesterase II
MPPPGDGSTGDPARGGAGTSGAPGSGQTVVMSHRFSELLAFAPTADDRYRAEPAWGSGFLFGGLTMGVAITVAGATVDDALVPKSLRTAFLSFGEWGPMDVDVERVNTSRSFAGRRLRLRQGDRTVAVLDVTFHRPEEGVDRQRATAPQVPGPDDCEDLVVQLGGVRPIELRPVRATHGHPIGRIHPFWSRVHGDLGNDPVAHAAGLAFMSDYMVVYSPFEPGSGEAAGLRSFTLEHSVWFHRPFAADRWLLFDAEPLTQSGGRFVTRGTVHDDDGALVASFVQEGFVRPVD